MPSVSEHVSIDFAWSEIIDRSLNSTDITAIALAAAQAGIGAALIDALQLAINAANTVTAAEARDLDADFDYLVNDFARGLPIEHDLARLARVHCNRVIVPQQRFNA